MFSEGGRHADAGEDPASVPHERHSGVQSHAQVDERVVFAQDDASHQNELLVKGAPELLINRCSRLCLAVASLTVADA